MSRSATNGNARKQASKAVAVVLVLSSLVITFLVLELGTRAWLRVLASKDQIAKFGSVDQIMSFPRQYSRHHYLPFIPTPDFEEKGNRHNSLGFRGEEVAMPKSEGAFRIALLGGSTTYSSSIEDYRNSYPYRLQVKLKRINPSIEVLNAGVSRYSTWESMLNLALRVLDTEPDVVIVYHGINDVHQRLVFPYEAYRGDNSGSRIPYTPPFETGLMHSALYRVLAVQLGYRKPLAGILYLRTHDWLATNLTMEFRRESRTGSYPGLAFKEATVAEMLSVNRPIYFQRNLENIIAICKIHGIDVILMTFASSKKFPEHVMASSDEYQSAYSEQNDIVRQLCRKHDLHCYDFAEEMPATREFWADGRHVSLKGANLKAKLVASFLAQSGVLPQVSPHSPESHRK